MATVQTTKEKLAGTKVTNLDAGRWYLVDAEQNQPLFDEISGDELPIPAGYLIILKDGDDVTVKIGLGTVWSEAITLTQPAA